MTRLGCLGYNLQWLYLIKTDIIQAVLIVLLVTHVMDISHNTAGNSLYAFTGDNNFHHIMNKNIHFLNHIVQRKTNSSHIADFY